MTPKRPRERLDEQLVYPDRLALMAALASVGEAEVEVVGDALGMSGPELGEHVSSLAQAGYVGIRRSMFRRRQLTWLKLTRFGRRAYERHLAALREIAAD